MSIDLKPCPFCGGAATLEDQRLMWAARCTSCGAYVLGDRAPEPEQEMPAAYWEPFRQSAVARWNRRASLAAALRAAVEQAVPEPPDCGTPAKFNHDTNRPIGVVERARIDGEKKRGMVSVKFSRNVFAQEVMTDPATEDTEDTEDTAEGGTADEIYFRGIRAVLAARPATPPAPEPGEVAELVAALKEPGDPFPEYRAITSEEADRAATLLAQQAAPTPAVVPVAVSERPWEKGGWTDLDGECWWCPPDGPAYWSMANPAMVYGGWLLPAHAIPQPTPEAAPVADDPIRFDEGQTQRSHGHGGPTTPKPPIKPQPHGGRQVCDLLKPQFPPPRKIREDFL